MNSMFPGKKRWEPEVAKAVGSNVLRAESMEERRTRAQRESSRSSVREQLKARPQSGKAEPKAAAGDSKSSTARPFAFRKVTEGDEAWQAQKEIVVSGAGTQQVNGTYYFTAGSRRYEKPGNGSYFDEEAEAVKHDAAHYSLYFCQEFCGKPAGWYIADGKKGIYFAKGSKEEPPATGWEVYAGVSSRPGAKPPPTLRFEEQAGWYVAREKAEGSVLRQACQGKPTIHQGYRAAELGTEEEKRRREEENQKRLEDRREERRRKSEQRQEEYAAEQQARWRKRKAAERKKLQACERATARLLSAAEQSQIEAQARQRELEREQQALRDIAAASAGLRRRSRSSQTEGSSQERGLRDRVSVLEERFASSRASRSPTAGRGGVDAGINTDAFASDAYWDFPEATKEIDRQRLDYWGLPAELSASRALSDTSGLRTRSRSAEAKYKGLDQSAADDRLISLLVGQGGAREKDSQSSRDDDAVKFLLGSGPLARGDTPHRPPTGFVDPSATQDMQHSRDDGMLRLLLGGGPGGATGGQQWPQRSAGFHRKDELVVDALLRPHPFPEGLARGRMDGAIQAAVHQPAWPHAASFAALATPGPQSSPQDDDARLRLLCA